MRRANLISLRLWDGWALLVCSLTAEVMYLATYMGTHLAHLVPSDQQHWSLHPRDLLMATVVNSGWCFIAFVHFLNNGHFLSTPIHFQRCSNKG